MLCSWEDLGFHIDAKLGECAEPHYARRVLAAYVTMAFGSLGLFVHQRFYGQSINSNIGVLERG